MKKGVHFTNTHAMFPTLPLPMQRRWRQDTKWATPVTSATHSAPAFPCQRPGTASPFLESDPVLGDVDEHFSGDYLNQQTVMRAARAAGLSTAAIGKLGPALIFDHTERSGAGSSSM
jgi:hypothetical protein